MLMQEVPGGPQLHLTQATYEPDVYFNRYPSPVDMRRGVPAPAVVKSLLRAKAGTHRATDQQDGRLFFE